MRNRDRRTLRQKEVIAPMKTVCSLLAALMLALLAVGCNTAAPSPSLVVTPMATNTQMQPSPNPALSQPSTTQSQPAEDPKSSP
jgi:uncharacterized lipoprotein YajG